MPTTRSGKQSICNNVLYENADTLVVMATEYMSKLPKVGHNLCMCTDHVTLPTQAHTADRIRYKIRAVELLEEAFNMYPTVEVCEHLRTTRTAVFLGQMDDARRHQMYADLVTTIHNTYYPDLRDSWCRAMFARE